MNSGPTISVGSTGSDVRRLQVLLVEMKLLDPAGIDSSFGPNTQGVVQSFQEGAGLVVDGIVGPLTWGALPADPNTPQLAMGDTGAAVAALQQGLTAYSNEDPGDESRRDRRRLRSDDRRRGARVPGRPRRRRGRHRRRPDVVGARGSRRRDVGVALGTHHRLGITGYLASRLRVFSARRYGPHSSVNRCTLWGDGSEGLQRQGRGRHRRCERHRRRPGGSAAPGRREGRHRRHRAAGARRGAGQTRRKGRSLGHRHRRVAIPSRSRRAPQQVYDTLRRVPSPLQQRRRRRRWRGQAVELDSQRLDVVLRRQRVRRRPLRRVVRAAHDRGRRGRLGREHVIGRRWVPTARRSGRVRGVEGGGVRVHRDASPTRSSTRAPSCAPRCSIRVATACSRPGSGTAAATGPPTSRGSTRTSTSSGTTRNTRSRWRSRA